MPSLADKSAFLPAVLLDSTFQKDGVLFGTDPQVETDCQWVVVDPNRHRMAVWKKPQVNSDFVETAKSLKASVFTDGTLQHSRYEGTGVTGFLKTGFGYVGAEVSKSFHRAGIAGAAAIVRGLDFGTKLPPGWHSPLANVDRDEADAIRKSDDEVDNSWFVGEPYGRVIGQDQATPATARGGLPIDDTVSATNPTLGYFGRTAGVGFGCYQIGKGEPTAALVEAAGGLYAPALLNNTVTPDGFGSNMWFYWALAPLKPQPKDTVNLAGALAAYTKVAPKPLTGVIVGMYHKGKGGAVQHLANIGCSDAIKLDGGDSVLLGYDSTVLVGQGMSHHKRIWLQYGIAFFPV
jgi:hypothetical protein